MRPWGGLKTCSPEFARFVIETVSGRSQGVMSSRAKPGMLRQNEQDHS